MDEAILLTWVASKNRSYCENKNATCVRKKTPWKWMDLQKTNVCQISNWNLKFQKIWGNHSLKSTRKHIDFERVSFVCTLAQLTKKKKKENVWFCSGGFSYATDIALIASRLMLYRFFMWNLTWDSLVKQWIFLYSSMYTGTHLKNLTSWIHHHANTLYFFSCVYLKNVDMLSLLPTHFALL